VTVAGPRLTTQTLAVLEAMIEHPDVEWYGFDLSRRSGVGPGTLYPMLARLFAAGWLERRWERVDPSLVGRPRRRFYSLSGAGELAARSAVGARGSGLSPHAAGHLKPRPGLA
jgi:PadR family transcriptional regulator, regulatory protein PadR